MTIAIDAPTFGERLRTARAALGWSQDALAAQADLSEKTVRRAEAGAPVSAETRRTLARLLGVDQPAVAPASVAEPDNPYRYTAFDYPLNVSPDPNVSATAARGFLKAQASRGPTATNLVATDLHAYEAYLFGADDIASARAESAAVRPDYAERLDSLWCRTNLLSIALTIVVGLSYVCLVVQPYLDPLCHRVGDVLGFVLSFVGLAACFAPMGILYAVHRGIDATTDRILATWAAIAAHEDAERTIFALEPGLVRRWRLVDGRVETDEWVVLEGQAKREITGTHVDLTISFQDTSIFVPSLLRTRHVEAFAASLSNA